MSRLEPEGLDLEEEPKHELGGHVWRGTDIGQMMGEYNGFTKAINEAGVNLGGEALQPVATATTVQVRDGQTLTTDGLFAETKEGLGGFYLLECKDLDEALAWAAKCPGSWYGKVEVRPVMNFEEFDAADIEHKAVGSA